jgi:hypothetical protein
MTIHEIKDYFEDKDIYLSVWTIHNWRKELLEWAKEWWEGFEAMKHTATYNNGTKIVCDALDRSWIMHEDVLKANRSPKDWGKVKNPAALETKKEFKQDAGEISVSRNSRITSLQDLIEHCDIDLSIWDIDRHIINKREVWTFVDGQAITEPLYQVKARLKKKQTMAIRDMEAKTIDYLSDLWNLDTELYEYENSSKSYEYDRSEKLLEIAIFDAHINKLCLAQKSGNDWNHDIAKGVYLDMVSKMVRRGEAEWCTKSVLIVWNDFFQTDTLSGTTTAGTPVSESMPLQPAFVIGQSIIIAAIQMLLVLGPVDVVMVWWNHDRATTYFLWQVLNARYRDIDDVTIDNSMMTRKYYKFGRNLIMFAHWDQEKMKTVWAVMAIEAKEAWAGSDYKEVHLGHYHTQSVYESHWVIVRYLNSISWTDDWHFQKSFVWNVRWGTAFVWDRNNGMQGQFIFNI